MFPLKQRMQYDIYVPACEPPFFPLDFPAVQPLFTVLPTEAGFGYEATNHRQPEE